MKIDEKTLNTMQVMSICAMLLTLMTGHTLGFMVAMLMLTGLKIYAWQVHDRKVDIVFAAIYAAMIIFMVLDKRL